MKNETNTFPEWLQPSVFYMHRETGSTFTGREVMENSLDQHDHDNFDSWEGGCLIRVRPTKGTAEKLEHGDWVEHGHQLRRTKPL